MTIFQNTHEGLTNGAVIAADGSNTGGASGDAYTASSVLATGSLTASNLHPAHNNMAIYVVSNGAGSGDRARVQRDFAATDLVTLRFYLYWEEAPGVAVAFARIMATDNTGMATLQLNSAGALQLTSKTGTVRTYAAAHTFPNLYRYEFAIQKVTGATTDGKVQAAYFLGDNTTPIETFETTTTNIGALQAYRAYLGAIDTNAKMKAHLDSVKLDNASYALLGPGAATVNPPVLSVTTYTDRIVVVAAGTPGAGSGDTSVALSASPAPLATPAPGIFVFARQASTGADYTETITATASPSGTPSTAQVTIPKTGTTSTVNRNAPRTPAGTIPGSTWG